MFYILRSDIGTARAQQELKRLRNYIKVAPADSMTVDRALDANWRDLEDALQYFSAVSAKCDALITRNPKDFKLDSIADSIPVLTPKKFIATHL